ncbi:MAG: hypothetical protein QOF53_667 [Nocardioidaceae bacterium]|nr:hypothetical protein [Nocardioidaceae bacterium]
MFLVLRDGLAATTVEAISDRADVAPRTFFNYFDTKDNAILGLPRVRGDEDLATPHLGGDLVDSVVGLLMDEMGVSVQSRTTTHDDRLEVIRRHPEVLGGQLSQLTARAGRLSGAVQELMTATSAFSDDRDVAARAEVMMAMSVGAVRVALREWAADGRARPTDSIRRRATTLIRGTLRRLE